MDVRDLAPALLSLGRLIDASNSAINGDKVPIKIEAKALSTGSFEISIDTIISIWGTIKTLLDDPNTQSAKSLLEWIGLLGIPPAGGVIFLYRFLNGRKPDKVTPSPPNSFTVIVGDQSLMVPFQVLRLYQDITVNRAFNELLSVVDKGKIDKVEFRSEGSPKGTGALSLTNDDKNKFVLSEPQPETVIDDTRRLALSIRSLAFQEGNKWRLFDGQNTITATIEDRDFIDRVNLNMIRFAKGDILLCEVKTVQTQSIDGLKTEHSVLRVIEHRQAPTQITLPFDTGQPRVPVPGTFYRGLAFVFRHLTKARAFCLSSPDFNRPPIGKALPDNALRQFLGAFHIVRAKRNAVRISEIEFRDVAMKMLFVQG